MEPTIVRSLATGIRKVLKPQRKGDSVSCAYLYADGLIAVMCKRPDGLPGSYRTIDYWQILSTPLRPSGTGRVVLHDWGILRALPLASGIEWKGPSLSSGSENTRRQGIAVGHMAIRLNGDNGAFSAYQNAINIYELSNIGTGITIQDDACEFGPLDDVQDPIAVHYVVN